MSHADSDNHGDKKDGFTEEVIDIDERSDCVSSSSGPAIAYLPGGCMKNANWSTTFSSVCGNLLGGSIESDIVSSLVCDCQREPEAIDAQLIGTSFRKIHQFAAGHREDTANAVMARKPSGSGGHSLVDYLQNDFDDYMEQNVANLKTISFVNFIAHLCREKVAYPGSSSKTVTRAIKILFEQYKCGPKPIRDKINQVVRKEYDRAPSYLTKLNEWMSLGLLAREYQANDRAGRLAAAQEVGDRVSSYREDSAAFLGRVKVSSKKLAAVAMKKSEASSKTKGSNIKTVAVAVKKSEESSSTKHGVDARTPRLKRPHAEAFSTTGDAEFKNEIIRLKSVATELSGGELTELLYKMEELHPSLANICAPIWEDLSSQSPQSLQRGRRRARMLLFVGTAVLKTLTEVPEASYPYAMLWKHMEADLRPEFLPISNILRTLWWDLMRRHPSPPFTPVPFQQLCRAVTSLVGWGSSNDLEEQQLRALWVTLIECGLGARRIQVGQSSTLRISLERSHYYAADDQDVAHLNSDISLILKSGDIEVAFAVFELDKERDKDYLKTLGEVGNEIKSALDASAAVANLKEVGVYATVTGLNVDAHVLTLESDNAAVVFGQRKKSIYHIGGDTPDGVKNALHFVHYIAAVVKPMGHRLAECLENADGPDATFNSRLVLIQGGMVKQRQSTAVFTPNPKRGRK
ncbi:hypothetical protein DFS34DRAFT_686277 [Phlyctochytrium arcticum]|nr:hypothetical protein DFS34DRAFT_686277 [Phlyctochytrium arcticum]